MNDTLKELQKVTGVKMGKYDSEQNRLYNMCNLSILMLENIWEDVVTANLKDSQFILNWLDKLNEISIRN